MSVTIGSGKIKFTIYGHGHERTRCDSGEGEKGSMFYDADGNGYVFQLMPVKIPASPNTSGNSGNYRSGVGYTWGWNANSDGYRFDNEMLVDYPDYGASICQDLRESGKLAWDIYENNIWFTPPKLNGFSVRNLIERGIMSDAVGSCRLYKDAPLSNTYIETTIYERRPDFLKDATGVYEDVDLTGYHVRFDLVVEGVYHSGGLGLNEFDCALCLLEKYDGTKGIGICAQQMYRVPSWENGGNPNFIQTGQWITSSNNIFGYLDDFFGD